MESFIWGVISGMLLMSLKELPRIAWVSPRIYESLIRLSGIFVAASAAVVIVTVVAQFLDPNPRRNLMLLELAFLLACIHAVPRFIGWIIQKVRGAEDDTSHTEGFGPKAAFKPYEPRGLRRRR